MAEGKSVCFKSIVVEVRPKLQSVNVIARLEDNSDSDVKVNLSEHGIQLILNNNQIINAHLKGISLLVDSLSDVRIANNYASFRFSTCDKSRGSFKTELLQILKPHHESKLYESFLFRGKGYRLQCGNCSNDLSGDVYFTRVLPLPSENVEPSEMFCHSSNMDLNLNPKVTDIFYTHCYAHINTNIVKETLETRNIIVCKRCLCWLGIRKNCDTIRLWFNTVSFVHANNIHRTNPLNDVWITIKDVFKHSPLLLPRFIFVCESARDRTDYVLIWVIEKRLNIMLNITGEVEQQTTNPADIGLSEKEVAKVLFKYQNDKTGTVEEWFNEPNVTVVSVSKVMIHALTTHLHKYNKLLPHEFSKSNGYFVSYLLMY